MTNKSHAIISLKYTAAIILFAVILWFSRVYLSSSSMALGVFIYSFILFLMNYKNWVFLQFINKFFLILSIFFLSYLFILTDISTKGVGSLFLLLFMFSSAYMISVSFLNADEEIVFATIKSVFFIFALIGLSQIVVFGGARNIFPFYEASHYALFIGPFSVAYFVMTSSKAMKFLIILFLVGMGIFFPNVTIITYVFLLGLLHLRFSFKSIFFIVVGLLFFLYILLNFSYFHDRVFVWNKGTQNLSSLVYMEGLEDSYNSMVSTNGIGIGFQNMGTQAISSAGKEIQIILNNQNGLNRKDGGFILAKLVTEMGLFGFFLLSYFLFLFKICHKYLSRAKNKGTFSNKDIVMYSFIYTYSIEIFVRGAGYFTAGAFFFCIALSCYLIKDSRINGLRKFKNSEKNNNISNQS